MKVENYSVNDALLHCGDALLKDTGLIPMTPEQLREIEERSTAVWKKDQRALIAEVKRCWELLGQ